MNRMTTFEKEFPSLKHYVKVHECYDEEGYEENYPCVDQIEVERYCLDKQRVKEAINKCKKTLIPADVRDSQHVYHYNAMLDSLLKELGLE